MLSGSSHLQSFPLVVEQLGDVPGHPLHQVLGVVPLDFELTLLFVVNLQTEETASRIGFSNDVTTERLLIPKAGAACTLPSGPGALPHAEPTLAAALTVTLNKSHLPQVVYGG